MPKKFRPKKEERVFVIHGDNFGQTMYAAKVRYIEHVKYHIQRIDDEFEKNRLSTLRPILRFNSKFITMGGMLHGMSG